MQYEFLTSLYPTVAEMCAAIASTWLSGGGVVDIERMLAFLADASDGDLADDAIDGLGLSCREGSAHGAVSQNWMEARGVTRADIVDGFTRVRQECTEARG